MIIRPYVKSVHWHVAVSSSGQERSGAPPSVPFSLGPRRNSSGPPSRGWVCGVAAVPPPPPPTDPSHGALLQAPESARRPSAPTSSTSPSPPRPPPHTANDTHTWGAGVCPHAAGHADHRLRCPSSRRRRPTLGRGGGGGVGGGSVAPACPTVTGRLTERRSGAGAETRRHGGVAAAAVVYPGGWWRATVLVNLVGREEGGRRRTGEHGAQLLAPSLNRVPTCPRRCFFFSLTTPPGRLSEVLAQWGLFLSPPSVRRAGAGRRPSSALFFASGAALHPLASASGLAGARGRLL